jgi:hypothetical protein
VSGSSIFGGLLSPRLGNVVHREEFVKLLIGLAAAPDGLPGGKVDGTARAAAEAALKAHGIDPKATLEAIRSVSLQLERSAPELSHMARQSAAILVAAPNDFVAKINNWFDQTMDRTSQRFTASTRVITFAGALMVAFALQVDTPALVNRLAADKDLRDAFVKQASTVTDPAQAGDADTQKEREYRQFLAANGIIKLPSSLSLKDLAEISGERFFGILITGLLLSLGAPFWYGLLSQLLQLRSVLAGKDDTQRADRQLATDTPAGPGGSRPQAGAVPPALRGERGDLAAVG